MKLDKEQLLDLLWSLPRHERIVRLRSLYNLSQTDLARVANVARGTVSTWEAETVEVDGGRGHEPSKVARSRMGTYFGVPSVVFMDEWGAPEVAKKRSRRRGPRTKEGMPSAPEITVPPTPIKRIG